MSAWKGFSQLTVVGSDIFKDPLFSEISKSANSSVSIVYVEDIETLKNKRNDVPEADADFPEAILLSRFPAPREMRALQSLFPGVRFYGLPGLYSICFEIEDWMKHRPIFSFAMKKVVIALTGLSNPEKINMLASYVNWMGGSVRRKLESDVTHLIAYRCAGDKVRAATKSSSGVTVMRMSWISASWELCQHDYTFNPCDPEFLEKHRAKVFQECYLYFIGFTSNSSTLAELKRVVSEHGGGIADDLHDLRLTHVIVADDWQKEAENIDMSGLIVRPSELQDPAQKARRSSSVAIDSEMKAQITDVAYRVPVLRLDWFWKSLQSTVLRRARDYLYMPESQTDHETLSNSFFSTSQTQYHQYASSDALSPQSSAFEKENVHPDPYFSPRKSADISDVRMRHSTSLQQMSREEVIAQLADPLISPSGRRLSRNANSFGLDPPSPTTQATSTPAAERDKTPEEKHSQELEKSVRSLRKPLGALKASSSTEKRTSPAKVNTVAGVVETAKAVATAAAQEAEDREKALGCRQHRVLELIVTERNYFNVVKFLSQTAYMEVMDEQQDGGAILPRAEADRLFAKLNPIHQLHSRIMPQLEELERTFDPETSLLGEIFLPLLDDMERVYNHYMQTYDSSHVTELSTRYPRFLAYMRNVERNSAMGRQGLADLLVRPVQRLPSMLLLLQGIEKFTPKSHPDYWGVSLFTKKLDELLKNINDRMKQNDEYINLLRLFHEIGGAPPELLSASRSMVSELNVFLLDQRGGKMPVCEPVTIFLMTDCLEIVRPKKQNTSDSHAIQATVAALESLNTATSSSDHATKDGGAAKASTSATPYPEPVAIKSQPAAVSRTASGASASVSSAAAVASATASKKRYRFTHVNLIKLQDIKRVLDLSTPSPERAAFSLIVRGATDDFDQMFTFALAASATATAAMASGKYPEAVQSKIAKVERGAASNSFKRETKPESAATGEAHGSETALERLQHCVHEAKTSFLQRLCQHIMQVSFVNTKVEDLLVEMEPEVVLDFDLNRVFSLLSSGAYKPKKFTRQLGRAISMKTPRRQPYLWQKPHTSTAQQQQQQQSHQDGGGTPLQPATSSISLVSTGGGGGGATEPSTPSRHSVLGSIFGGILSHTAKPSPSFKSSTRSIHRLFGDDSPHRSDASSAVSTGAATPTAAMAHTHSQLSLTAAVQRKRKTADNLWLELVSTSDDEEISDDDDDDPLNVSVTGSVCNAAAAATGGDPDTLSIGSFSSSAGVGGGGEGPWPAYFPMVVGKKKVAPRDPARASAASLRSASLSMKGDSMSLGTGGASSGHGRQSFGGLMNATRKSICRSFLVGIRKPSKTPADQLMPPPPTPPLPQAAPGHPPATPSQQHRTSVSGTAELSVHASPFVGPQRAPLARPDDDLETGDDSRIPSATAMPRSSSSTAASTVVGLPRTPALDRSASECNLSLGGSKKRCSTGVTKTPLAGHRGASGLMRLPGVTSSAASLRNLFTAAASPFRVPSAVPPRSAAAQLAPPGAVSMVAPSTAAAAATVPPASSPPPVHAVSGPGVSNWSSLTTLLEEGGSQDLESKALELRQRCHKPEDTRSMVLQPSSSSSKLSLFKRHGGKKRKSTAVVMVESAVAEETQQTRAGGFSLRKSSSSSSSASSTTSASTTNRRESFFRRKFFK